MVIVVDIGHGGEDPGAVYKNVKEKNVVLKAGKILSRLLNEKHEIIMTRDSDVYVTLDKRCEIANNHNADIFISLHANAVGYNDANGVETLYYPGSHGGEQLARDLQEELFKEIVTDDRGIKGRRDLYVLKYTKMPAVLVELGFITNPIENCLLQQKYYLEELMKAIVRGIKVYEKGVADEKN